MRALLLILSLIFANINVEAQDELISLSQDFLVAASKGETTVIYKEKLAVLQPYDISEQLITDEKRIVFWVNIYNAFILDILKYQPHLYSNRNQFFNKKRINIAGKNLSFNHIEHGILRRSVYKYSLGYFKRLRIPKFEKQWRVDQVDPRIHFALNCGAKSCPPVRIYSDKDIDQVLDEASRSFLKVNAIVNTANNAIQLTPLISWFRADFGGISGAKEMLLNYGIIDHTQYKIQFSDYDWTLDLDNVIQVGN